MITGCQREGSRQSLNLISEAIKACYIHVYEYTFVFKLFSVKCYALLTYQCEGFTIMKIRDIKVDSILL